MVFYCVNFYTQLFEVCNSCSSKFATSKHNITHEFGHLAGLKDRYNLFTGSEEDNGWEANIMSRIPLNVEQKNIDGIVGETVKEYNKFKSAYTNYKATKNTTRQTSARARYHQRMQERRFAEYDKTGNFKYVKKPVLIRFFGN